MIDPGDGAAQLRLELAGMGARCAGILITHCHWDHLMGVADLAEGTGAPVYVPELERPVLEQPREFFPDIPLRPYEGATGVEGGETVAVAGIDFETVSIPGHSPGHLAYYADDCLFSGDLLFAGSVGRTDLPFSDWETLLASIQALFERFPPETGRLSRARPGDDARRRAADESVPRRAPHRMIKAPRGTHDILPDEQPLFRHVTGTFAELAERYGYRAITTPTIEHVELIERTSGEGSDIIQKEIYTLVDRSERTLALRPEATAPVARAYLEHGMHREPQPVKTYLVGQMFRYDRPQRGRFREFWQLNVEAMGSEDPALDAEVIQLYDELLRRLGIRRYWLELNSIGDRECRPAYVDKLNEWLEAHPDVLTPEVEQKRATSPLRVFDVKDERVREALEDAPKIGESLCDSCREHFDAVRRYLDAAGVAYRLSPALVRGLDYYTRTTFEFLGEALGAKDSILGGGRYDYLIEQIGGPPTPGVGWAAGVERLLMQVEDEGAAGAVETPKLDVFFACEDGAPREQIVGLMAELRRNGRSVDTDYAGRSLKGQLTQAGRLGAATTVIVRDGEALLRRAGTEDEVVPLDALEKAL